MYIGRQQLGGPIAKLDDISSEFDGIKTSFNLSLGATAYFANNPFALMVSLGGVIQEPITSPTFPLSQHYPLGSPPLIHLDLYRIEEKNAANEFFLQEEEESKAIGALMVVEWPERLSLPMPDAWRGKLEYSSENQSRFFQLIPPLDKDNKLSISSK
mgnify:CR=1 FL=1